MDGYSCSCNLLSEEFSWNRTIGKVDLIGWNPLLFGFDTFLFSHSSEKCQIHLLFMKVCQKYQYFSPSLCWRNGRESKLNSDLNLSNFTQCNFDHFISWYLKIRKVVPDCFYEFLKYFFNFLVKMYLLTWSHWPELFIQHYHCFLAFSVEEFLKFCW